MDGISPGAVNGVAGALVSGEAARQQSARAIRQRRLAERRGGDVGNDDEASDAPVEQVDEPPAPHSQPRPPVGTAHLDVIA